MQFRLMRPYLLSIGVAPQSWARRVDGILFLESNGARTIGTGRRRRTGRYAAPVSDTHGSRHRCLPRDNRGRARKEFLLVGPFNGRAMGQFPAVLECSVYVNFSGGHGSYQLNLQLRNSGRRGRLGVASRRRFERKPIRSSPTRSLFMTW